MSKAREKRRNDEIFNSLEKLQETPEFHNRFMSELISPAGRMFGFLSSEGKMNISEMEGSIQSRKDSDSAHEDLGNFYDDKLESAAEVLKGTIGNAIQNILKENRKM